MIGLTNKQTNRDYCFIYLDVNVFFPLDSARVPPTGFDNSMPQIRNPVDKLNVMAGELLQFQVGS